MSTPTTSTPLTPTQIQHYHTHGYLIIENLFTPTEAARIRQIAAADPDITNRANSNSNYDENTQGGTKDIDTRLVYTPTLTDNTYSAIAQSQRERRLPFGLGGQQQRLLDAPARLLPEG